MNYNEKLPPGWVRVKSKSRPGKDYFFNQKLNQSLWKLEDLKKFGETGLKTSPAKKASPKKTSLGSGLSDRSRAIKKNIARDRMTKLQNVLAVEAKCDELTFPKGEKANQAWRKCSKEPVKVVKKNIAMQRLKTLNSSLIEEVKASNKKQLDESLSPSALSLASQKPTVPFQSTKTELPLKSNEVLGKVKDAPVVKMPKLGLKQAVECSDVDMLDLSQQEVPQTDLQQQPEPYETMEWEDIPEQEVISKVHEIRKCEKEDRTSSLVRWLPTVKKTSFFKTEFYIIVDTNVMLSNIDFIKDIKGKHFKDIGRATIYLPYIVLCELDKIKSYNDQLAMLARRAISFVDDCFGEKDQWMIGQSGKDSFQKQIIPIYSADDEILNCCLHIQESSVKLILLTNDRNLRNKAFVNKIEAFSRDTLNFVDYNVRNEIKFESN